MKILGAEPYSRTPGHFSWVATRTCEGLARRGNETTLVTYGGILDGAFSGTPSFKVLDAAGSLKDDPDVTRIGGKPRVRSFRSLLKRGSLQWRTLRTAFALLESAHHDVIYVFSGHPLVLLLAVRLFGKDTSKDRTGVVLHLIYPERLSRTRGVRHLIGDWLYRKALLSLLRQGRVGLRVMDQPFKEALIDRLKLKSPLSERIGVVPHGVDSFDGPRDQTEARRRLGLSPDESLFLFFGILRRNKRYDIAIRAMEGLSACRLLIVGQPLELDADALHDLIRQCGCERAVSLEIGFVADARMQDYFLAADAVMATYAKSFVGSSGVLFQACTYGRCVIGGNVGVIGRTISENGIGLTVEPENPETLRQVMREFMVLPSEERARMEQRARLLAQRESWDVACAHLEVFFRQLVP